MDQADGWIVHDSHSYYEPLLADWLGCTPVSVILGGEFIMQAPAQAKHEARVIVTPDEE